MGFVRVRGNPSLLFLLFLGATTLLGGAMYRAYELYQDSAGSLAWGLATLTIAGGFTFSLAIAARILYKAAA